MTKEIAKQEMIELLQAKGFEAMAREIAEGRQTVSRTFEYLSTSGLCSWRKEAEKIARLAKQISI